MRNNTNNQQDDLLLKRVQQAVDKYNKSGINVALNFLRATEINDIQFYLGKTVSYSLIGGYDDALSKRLVIGEVLNQNDYVSCLCAKYNQKFNSITHRDVTGALYSLQIQRDRFGDLWVEEDKIYLYCEKEIENYICQNFNQVANCSISFKPVEFTKQIFKFDEFTINVSSLRLDNVVSDVIRKSREKAKVFIHQQMVSVNYKTIEDCDFLCHNKDILSLASIGRFMIDEIDTNPKSGKYIVGIKKFK